MGNSQIYAPSDRLGHARKGKDRVVAAYPTSDEPRTESMSSKEICPTEVVHRAILGCH